VAIYPHEEQLLGNSGNNPPYTTTPEIHESLGFRQHNTATPYIFQNIGLFDKDNDVVEINQDKFYSSDLDSDCSTNSLIQISWPEYQQAINSMVHWQLLILKELDLNKALQAVT
jgi:hypothetical protein